MRNRSKFILAALAAALLLSLGVSSAPARSFRINERNFEFIWDAALGAGKTDLSIADVNNNTVTCKVTMLGSFTNSTIAKATGVNIGEIHHVTWIEACANGARLIVLGETLTWPIRYASFAGTLPAISRITLQVLKLSFRVQTAGGLACLFRSEVNEPAVFIIEEFNNGAPETVTADATRTIVGEPLLCNLASPMRLSGRGLVRNLPTTAKLTLTLI